EELLTLDVCLEGSDLTGADRISLPPQGTLSYKVTYSPVRVGKGTGRSREELLPMSWIYPLCGVPVEAPFENSPLAVLQCEVGCQLERTVDVKLTGYVPGNEELKVQEEFLAYSLLCLLNILQFHLAAPFFPWTVLMEDFLCKIRSDSEADTSGLGECLSTSIQAARRDPESGIIMLTLHLTYSPTRICR
ncbi:hypothetical protein GOODEAATRI_013061, partial [Goodea atripinnis]